MFYKSLPEKWIQTSDILPDTQRRIFLPGLSPTAGLYPRSGINTRVGLCEHQASVLAGTNVLVLYSILVLFRELL